jgi:hypothetical protein
MKWNWKIRQFFIRRNILQKIFVFKLEISGGSQFQN